MTDSVTKAKAFANLHQKGKPVIIYNAWDGGSAKTIASCGAQAIATFRTFMDKTMATIQKKQSQNLKSDIELSTIIY